MQGFIDTNVLVYAYDHRDLHKQDAARALLRELFTANTAVISTQVVQEFCNILLHKLKIVDADALADIIQATLSGIVRHQPDTAFYRRAIALHQRYDLSFYDALIIQAALDLGCDTLYSEDLQAGQKFGSLTVANPFAV